MTCETASEHPRTTFLIRAGIGLLQGLGLFALTDAADARSWPATDPMLHRPPDDKR